MKILHINDKYCDLGGTEKYLLDICNALEKMGNQIITISSSAEKEHISVQGRKEYFVKPSYGLRSGLKMWRTYRNILEQENPDIIHLHNTHYFVSPLIIKKLSSLKPTVKFAHDARLFCPSLGRKVFPLSSDICHYPLGIHCFNKKGCYPFHLDRKGLFDNLNKFLFVFYELRVSRSLDRIIVGSQYMYDELLNNGVSRDRLVILPPFVSIVDKDSTLNTTEGDTNESVILWVGRFDDSKGERDLLNALSLLKISKWKALLVGDGPYKDAATHYAKEKGIHRKVSFPGQIPYESIQELYEKCSFVVMSSKVPESFGLVGIEAMAKGKPIIAYDIGAVKEWLIDGVTGILVKKDNIQELSLAIEKLICNKKLTFQLGLSGNQRVKKQYSQEKHLASLITLYNDAIKIRSL